MQSAPASLLLRRLAPASALAALLALGGCGSSVLNVQVALVTKSCSTAPELDPLAGVSQLKFTVYGDGIDPVKFQTLAPLAQRSVEVPAIPAGPRRRIVVEGIAPDSAKTVISRGETGPMDFATSDGDVSVAVFLRRTDAFSPVAAQNAPTTCVQMAEARTAHTATVLEDGRVLIAGGFTTDAQGNATYLKSTEIYDPRTGQLSAGPDMNLPRAYHTADHIPGTSLTVLAGGESGGPGTPTGAIMGAEIYDETLNKFTFKAMKVGRTRHASAVPPGGDKLLLVGGYNSVRFGSGLTGTPLSSTEVFDPKTKEFTLGPTLPTARGELTAIGLGTDKVLVVGGYDGSKPLGDALLFVARSNGDYDLAADYTAQLKVPRLWPMLAPVDDTHVMVAGGFSDRPDGLPHSAASSAVEIVDLDKKTASPASALLKKRGHGGAVKLADGTIIVAGGGYKDSTGPYVANESADVFVADTSATGGVKPFSVRGKMQDGRYLGRFVLLQDGSVLATGGTSYSSSGQGSVLKSLEVYQPAYQASPQDPYR